jgi:hypothetical protein
LRLTACFQPLVVFTPLQLPFHTLQNFQCFFWLFGQDEMVATQFFCQLIFWRY